jgi:uncharacterized protein YjbJ (UPF0337 family)
MINRIEGMGHEAKGAVKEAVGQATHNHSQQLEGSVERHAGKAEQMIALLNDRSRRSDARR